MKSIEEKYRTVIDKNTYYFVNQAFEQKYEGHVTSIRDKLLNLKNKIDSDGLKPSYYLELIKSENGLTALLALTGFSDENFKRLLTVIRLLSNDELHKELYIKHWAAFDDFIALTLMFKDLHFFVNGYEDSIAQKLSEYEEYKYFDISSILASSHRIAKANREIFDKVQSTLKTKFTYKKRLLEKLTPQEFKDNIAGIIKYVRENLSLQIEEWSDRQIHCLLQVNGQFVHGLVNLFFKGSSIKTLVDRLPLFELKKLSITKLSFKLEEIIDSLVRYKQKGSYSAQKENNAEVIIAHVLDDSNITWETGDLKELVRHASVRKRTLDFIIPSKANPRLIVESTFLCTTSSGQGDKAKTENQVRGLLARHYPDAKFVGFVDGVGWYVRKGDLRRMVQAYEDVFTFHPEELERFIQYVKGILDT